MFDILKYITQEPCNNDTINICHMKGVLKCSRIPEYPRFYGFMTLAGVLHSEAVALKIQGLQAKNNPT